MNFNLYALFSEKFIAYKNHCAIELESGETYTYRDLDEMSAQYANLLQQLGLRKNDRVAAQVEKSIDALLLYLGCLRSGIVYLPLNPAYKDAELNYFYQDSKPTLIVCQPENLTQTQQIAKSCNVTHVETLGENTGTLVKMRAEQNKTFSKTHSEKNDIAVILYTSGTTGRSKGAMLTHHNLATNGIALSKYWGFNNNDTLLHMLPTFHVHGLFFACHCAFLTAAKMIFIDKFSVDKTFQFLSRATVMMGVPTYYTRLLADERLDKKICENMRLFTSGSAPLLEKTFLEFQNRTGHILLERYGMTETGVLTSNPLQGERRVGTVGFALPNSYVRVTDNGDIQVKGDNVFIGYWNREKTLNDFTLDGYFNTGDQGFIDKEGYLHILGRSKDMIISGGLNVYPKEIEQCLDQIEGVAETAVIGLPHNDFGEAITALVVKKTNSTVTANNIIQHAKSQLANFKIPKRIIFTTELPRNIMGKVQKHILREKHRELYSENTTDKTTTSPH